MPAVQANGLTIEYEERGASDAPVILLVMGFGAQLTLWPDDFCDALADGGFRVVRFDNRDIGLSQKFDHAPVPDIMDLTMRAMRGEKLDVAYTLDDMTLDAVGLLDALGIETAHVIGMSMGGMIAQLLAANHAPRVKSLVSIMSTSGNPGLPPGKPEVLQTLTNRPTDPDDREALIAHGVKVFKMIGSPGYPVDDAALRARVSQSIDRSFYPQGATRQFAAIIAGGSRVEALKTISTPSLVIHGADDPLVPVDGGKDTARHIPGAELRIVDGMGHDIAPGLVPTLAAAILDHCRKAEG